MSKIKTTRILLPAILLSLFSCSKDDKLPDNSNVSAPVVSSISLEDISNNGNGSDLKVSFKKVNDEDKILEYRIIVATSSDLIYLNTAQSLSKESYTTVSKKGEDISVTLTPETKDTRGELLYEFVEYRIYILSVADGLNAGLNALSKPTNIMKLSPTSH